MIDNRKVPRLQEQRIELSARLFLVRCCIALLCIGTFHLIEQSSISWKALTLYALGTPLLLWLYDQCFCSRR